jgi:L,D-transpeptidase YbiS
VDPIEPRAGRYIYAVLLLGWLAVFGAEAAGLARWSLELGRASESLDAAGATLSGQARESAGLVRQTRGISGELEYLGNLPNILPKDKGYLRTQRAVSDDIAALRRKLDRSIKGSLHIIIDAKTNKLYLKKGFKLLWQADCSVGRGGMLVDKKTGQRWQFVTPRGEFRVMSKAQAPAWKKPDWAFVEHGYLIHGTKDERVLGRPASHGCVRLGAEDLAKLWAAVPVGTRVFIIY